MIHEDATLKSLMTTTMTFMMMIMTAVMGVAMMIMIIVIIMTIVITLKGAIFKFKSTQCRKNASLRGNSRFIVQDSHIAHL